MANISTMLMTRENTVRPIRTDTAKLGNGDNHATDAVIHAKFHIQRNY